MEVISEPLALLDLLDGKAGISVRQRQEEVPAGHDNREDDATGNPSGHHALVSEPLARGNKVLGSRSRFLARLDGLVGWLFGRRLGAEDELHECSGNQARGKMGGEVVVQEELTAHDPEREVVGRPREEEEASRVVETGPGA